VNDGPVLGARKQEAVIFRLRTTSLAGFRCLSRQRTGKAKAHGNASRWRSSALSRLVTTGGQILEKQAPANGMPVLYAARAVNCTQSLPLFMRQVTCSSFALDEQQAIKKI
jgi:hypothetical protein